MLPKRLWQIVDQVRRDQRRLAKVIARPISGKAVEVNTQLGCLEGFETLTEKRPNEARQHVACAASRHSGVTSVVDVNPVPVSHYGAMAL